MELNFNIHYRAEKGQVLKLFYALDARTDAVALTALEGGKWTGVINAENAKGLTLQYRYCVTENGKILRKEHGAREVSFAAGYPRTVTFFDKWQDAPDDAYLDTNAARYALSPRKHTEPSPATAYYRTLILRARCGALKDGENFVFCSNQPAFGGWEPAAAPQMAEIMPNEWTLALDASKINFPLEYKFVIYDGKTAVWQDGDNFKFDAPAAQNDAVIINDLRPVFSRPAPRAAGVVLPVFSLRSENGFGSGDFGDLKKLADWAAKTGQKIIQLLPVNDTTITNTWTDSYPYNGISVYALHPLYMDLNALPVKQDKKFKELQKELNALETVDYERVTTAKRKYIRDAFKKEGGAVLKTEGYKNFWRGNGGWLMRYAAFSYLRDKYGTADFKKWPQYGAFNDGEIGILYASSAEAKKEMNFYFYMQYKLHEQLLAAADYARSNGVILKGDIPIGVSPHSVEVWADPRSFNTGCQAGAPPDPFSVVGQNWGFPTYNWDDMALDGYLWWTKRMKHMALYFDAYRIDHVLGFFRIWEIPAHSVNGLLGRFSPALPMDEKEITSFGLTFRPEFLKPYISGDMVKNIFGPRADDVKNKYLKPLKNGLFEMKPEFDTQRKAQDVLHAVRDEHLKEGLYSLISSVLFVADKNKPAAYHPRISAPTDYFFKSLMPADQAAFTKLYNHYFYERHNDFWRASAMKKLPPLVHATAMLPCAEDLGMIPACVEGVMKELKMLSLEIQRMPKTRGQTFADTKTYPYLSVCTPSTHDMTTLRGWWKEDKKITQKFYNEILGVKGDAPEDMTAEICEAVVNMHLQSPSMLALISFQDWTAVDVNLRRKDIDAERVNVPAVARYYWRYRMHITLEKLLSENNFNAQIKTLIQSAGR